MPVTQHTASSREVIDEALRALGEGQPSEIVQWWTARHGPVPVSDSSIRHALTRWEGRRYARVPGEDGVYRLMSEEEQASARVTTADLLQRVPEGRPSPAGTVLRMRLGNDTTITIRLTIHQDGPPLDATAEVVSEG